jgi:hypothetical protein
MASRQSRAARGLAWRESPAKLQTAPRNCLLAGGPAEAGERGLPGLRLTGGATPARQIYSGLSVKRCAGRSPRRPDLGLVPAGHVLLLATVQGPKVPGRQPFTLQSSTRGHHPGRESAAAEAVRGPGGIRLPTAGMRVQARVSSLNPPQGCSRPGRNPVKTSDGFRCQALGLPPLAHGGRRDRHFETGTCRLHREDVVSDRRGTGLMPAAEACARSSHKR